MSGDCFAPTTSNHRPISVLLGANVFFQYKGRCSFLLVHVIFNHNASNLPVLQSSVSSANVLADFLQSHSHTPSSRQTGCSFRSRGNKEGIDLQRQGFSRVCIVTTHVRYCKEPAVNRTLCMMRSSSLVKRDCESSINKHRFSTHASSRKTMIIKRPPKFLLFRSFHH